MIFQSTAFAGAYLDTYKVEIQRELVQINIKIQNNTASNFEKARKEYLVKRLKEIQNKSKK